MDFYEAFNFKDKYNIAYSIHSISAKSEIIKSEVHQPGQKRSYKIKKSVKR